MAKKQTQEVVSFVLQNEALTHSIHVQGEGLFLVSKTTSQKTLAYLYGLGFTKYIVKNDASTKPEAGNRDDGRTGADEQPQHEVQDMG